MKQKRTFIVLLIVLAILVLGVAYAAISGTDLVITGAAEGVAQDGNVDVYFSDAKITELTSVEVAEGGATSVTRNLMISDENTPFVSTVAIDGDDDTKATFDVKGLTHEGDYAVLVYTIKDRSEDMDAELDESTIDIDFDNAEWFTVECVLSDTDLTRAEANSQTATVTVTLNKTVINAADEAAAKTTGTITITANPVGNN